MRRNDESTGVKTRRTFLTAAATFSLTGTTALAGCALYDVVNPDTGGQKQTATTKPSSPSPTWMFTTTPGTEMETVTTTVMTTTQQQKDKVTVLSDEFYTEKYGGFGVKGKLENVSDETLDVDISVEFYDDTGTRVAEGMDSIHDLSPGKKETFDASDYGWDDFSSKDIADYKLTVEVSSDTNDESTPKLVTILSDKFYTDNDGFGVKGTLKNMTDTTLNYVEVSVVFYDDTETRLAEGNDTIRDLSAGTKVSFDADGYSLDDFSPKDITDHKISTDAEVF